jgi:hypothetical protein
MKRVAICLALLIIGASFLLEGAWACSETVQNVGQVTLPDNSCSAGCMQYDVNVVFNKNAPTTVSWQYRSLGCTSCPTSGATLSCGN